MTIAAVVAAKLPRRIVDCISYMRAIEGALPRNDGVVAFTRLYRAVTEGVEASVEPGAFRDGRFIRWLDVVFANLYFRALRHAIVGGGPVPRAWAPLFEARGRRGVLPLQFALAGMNAHINRDLPLALVQTWRALKLEPDRDGPQYADFTAVNALLADVEEQVKASYLTGLAGHADEALGRLDDVIAMWKITRAREAAWTNGEVLWALRDAPPLSSHFQESLDRMVGLAGRGLLRRVL